MKKKPVKKIMEIGLMNIVGTGMIGATASMHSSLPTGTAKTITGVIPGLQATALVGENLKAFNFPKQKRKGKRRK